MAYDVAELSHFHVAQCCGQCSVNNQDLDKPEAAAEASVNYQVTLDDARMKLRAECKKQHIPELQYWANAACARIAAATGVRPFFSGLRGFAHQPTLADVQLK